MASGGIALLRENLGRIILGKPDVIDLLIVCLLADGHVLIEDVPGVGKTTLARALARSIDGTFKRIQFTPDLLPTDITGVTVYDREGQAFVFREGPIFAHVVLADEINRAPPRTQAALLEAMAEGHVTADGRTLDLPLPFLVMATQNPLEFQGTYPLPESELDRFLMRIEMGYPSANEELEIARKRTDGDPLAPLGPVVRPQDVLAVREAVRQVHVAEGVATYIVEVVRRTREQASLLAGASPRGTLGLYRAAQARAYLQDRSFATPDDVKALAGPVLAHRLVPRVRREVGAATQTARRLVEAILGEVAVP